MKKTLLTVVFALAVSFGFSQMQVNLGGAYLKGDSENNNNVSRWGGSAAIKGMVGDNFALGLGFRTFPKIDQDINMAGINYVRTSNISQLFIPVELILNSQAEIIQPYLGGDLGLQFSNNTWRTTVDETSNSGVENKKTFVYLAPKIGFNAALGEGIGLFAEGSYGFTFGDGSTDLNVGTETFRDGPTSKHFLGQAGLFFRLNGAR